MKRGGYINRYARLERHTEMKRSNPARRRKSYAKNYGDRADRIREMPCTVAGKTGPGTTRCWGRPVAAHSRARGMGGCNGDRRELWPACWHHHCEAGERHSEKRRQFEERYGVDLELEAARLAELFDEEGLP